MQQIRPTVRARELGLALRRAVAATGMEGRQLARQLGFSEAKISNIYTGRRHPSEVDVSAILGVCGIKGPARDHLLKLAREAHEPSDRPFHLMEFGDQHPVVHIEDQTCTALLERKKTTTAYRRIVSGLEQLRLLRNNLVSGLPTGQANWARHRRSAVAR